jgi:enoyl-CoA hydratase/carnithine racemase
VRMVLSRASVLARTSLARCTLLCRSVQLSSVASKPVRSKLGLHGEPVFVSVFPGSRVLELRHSKTGNILTKEVTSIIEDKLENMKKNDAISCVWFASHDPDLFSFGLDGSAKDQDVLKRVHSMATLIKNYNKITLTMYGGVMTGTAFAAFAGSKYRLGASTLSLKITELSQGSFPGAGLAHFFANAYDGGMAMARYLAISGREVRAHDLFSMGLLTHLVEEEAQNSLTHALAETIANPAEDAQLNIPRDTGTVVRESSVAELLDTMHIESDLDILSHSAWDKYILVPPGRWDTLEPEEDNSNDLITIDSQVKLCFDEKFSVDETRKALSAINKPWATEALKRMDALDAKVLQNWWRLTAFANDKTKKLPEVLAEELLIVSQN